MLGEELGLSEHAIRPSASFRDHGADSMFSLRLIHALSEETEVRLSHSDLAAIYHAGSSGRLPRSIHQRSRHRHTRRSPLSTANAFAPQLLSEGQKGLWVQQKLYPEMCAYNVPLAFRVERIDRPALAQACRFVLEQFPILSTAIEDADPEPRIIGRTFGDPLADRGGPARHRQRCLCAPARQASRSISVRIRRSASNYCFAMKPIVLVVVHHIVFDGVSAVQFTSTFWSAYQCFVRGAAPSAPPAAGSYAEFVEWERRYLQSPEGEADLAYWRRELAGDLPVLQIPADRAADPARPFEGDSLDRSLTPELSHAARACAAHLGINRAAFFLGVFEILLYRYTGQEDILIAVPTAGRPERRFEQTIGYFANMIPVRATVAGSAEAAAFLNQIQQKLTAGLDHAAYPFAAMTRQLRHDALLRPLHHVSYSYQNFLDEQPAGPAGVAHLPDVRQEGDGALALEIFDSGPGVRVVAGFDSRQFAPCTIRRLLDHFVHLVESVSAHPDATIAALDLLSSAERDRILTRWNHITGPVRREGNVPQWIQQQAARDAGCDRCGRRKTIASAIAPC